MKIIDFEVKGNQIKFYVGADNCVDYWGDDWDDCPYEHNAGSVYDRYCLGWFVKTFDFDDVVMEPANTYRDYGSQYCKEDMKKRKVPCVCVLPAKYKEPYTSYYEFSDISGHENAIKYYFGDIVDETQENIHYMKKVQGETLYVRFKFEGDVRVKNIIAHMLSESLKIAANDRYIEDFSPTYDVIETLTVSKYKHYIEVLIKNTFRLYKFEGEATEVSTLEVELVNGRCLGRHNKETYNICCQSECNFDIGALVIV